MKTILLVGAGNMGFAMLSGWLTSLASTYNFIVLDPAAAPRLATLSSAIKASTTAFGRPDELPADLQLDAIVLATKPDSVCSALQSLSKYLQQETVIVSVAAGLSIDQIRKTTTIDNPTVRVMPNIGAMVGHSASAGFASPNTLQNQLRTVQTLFDALGRFVWLDNEKEMHTVTAVSGSGPAYFFALCEAMIAAACENGLSPAVAAELVHTTCSAAGRLLEETPDSALLREQVTSPNGTTAAGLAALGQNEQLQRSISMAIQAARQRSMEMT